MLMLPYILKSKAQYAFSLILISTISQTSEQEERFSPKIFKKTENENQLFKTDLKTLESSILSQEENLKLIIEEPQISPLKKKNQL